MDSKLQGNTQPKDAPILTMRGVSKRFGSTIALDGVDLTVRKGEVHAIIGENGAGKSTLMNILCGIHKPDAGEIHLGGEPYQPRDPRNAANHGLAMIHQELTLAPELSVEANIMLGREYTRLGFLNRGANRQRARESLAKLERGDIDLDGIIRNLGMGEQQIVEIARALCIDARIIVMDEPTSSLSGRDKTNLFDVIRRLKARGLSIIYISHFLEEVEEICDGFTVLRDGRTVGAGRIQEVVQEDLVRMMIGREIKEVFPECRRRTGEPILRVTSMSAKGMPHKLSLELHRGEILGLAGLVGAGRTESLRAIFGLDPIIEGRIDIIQTDGLEIKLGRSIPSRLKHGLGLLSEDRKNEGLAIRLSVAENIIMSSPERISTFGFIRSGAVKSAVNRLIKELSIRSATPGLPVNNLSGGNQQKVAIARLLQQEADVFLLDEPTRGIDIGSKVQIYRLMTELAERDKGILFVSSYLPELMGVCDRIAVMSRGELIEMRKTADWTEHDIMLAATSGGGQERVPS